MKRVYYKSKWSKAALGGKKVQFDLPLTAGGLRVAGFGKFCVHIRKDLVSIDIEMDNQRDPKIKCRQIYEPSLADRIEPHPDTSMADFRLFA